MWARRATCIPSLWHSQGHKEGAFAKIIEDRKNIKDHQGAEAKAGWWAFGLVELRWRLRRIAGTLDVGRAVGAWWGSVGAWALAGSLPAPPKPLAAKTPTAPVPLSLAGSSKAFIV